MSEYLRIAGEVVDAVASGRPVVALETTIVTHGFPPDEGLQVGRECEQRVREAGAVPATTAVLDGAVRVGLEPHELERIADAGLAAAKAGPRDLGVLCASGAIGATTVGGTLAAAALAGIRFAATGGIGGVHRGWVERPDVSADLPELARTPVLIVCSGAKSLLDVTATAEALETLGVPLLGFRTDTLPLFYATQGGPPVERVDDAGAAARLAHAHWGLGRPAGIVLTRPADPSLEDAAPLIEEALEEAAAQGVTGPAVTPFVLARIHARSDGRTLAVNRRLAADNSGLAAAVAVAYAAIET